MANEDQIREETTRDITAARAEIVGRRDQVTAEYADRLAALEQVAADLDGGTVEPKAAQAQIRRILGGERSGAGSRNAGRTKIGMTLPTARPTKAPPAAKPASQREGPSATRAHVAVSKLIGQIDHRIIHVLRTAVGAEAREEARLELSFLLQTRRSLEGYVEEMPTDVILLTSVVEYAEHAESALGDLEAGGEDRIKRLLEHNRTLASELLALGGAVTSLKDQIVKTRALLGTADANSRQILKQAIAVFEQLQRELEKRIPVQKPSLLDELLRSS